MTRMSIELSEKEHQKFKIFAAAKACSLKEFVISAMYEKITRELNKEPNEETLKAFRDSDEKRNLITHNSLKKLFEDFGI